MTLLDAERLVRRITELQREHAEPAVAGKLAEDFAAVCHAANLRLHQCEAMIRAGDRFQAIQLAETSPNLLDLVTVLEFEGSSDWRRTCQENGLAVAETIDARGVDALNECYSQGITTDHPLYAAYREACLARNDEEAVRALQSITRLNPADTNAASELGRLEGRVLATKLKHLSDLLAGGTHEVILAQVEAIETFGFKCAIQGDVWRAAQGIRCGLLLDALAELRDAGQWQEALARVDLIHRVREEAQVELASAQLRRLQSIQSWGRELEAKDRAEKEFDSLVAEMQYRLQSEAGAKHEDLAELENAAEELNDLRQRLQKLGQPLPESLAKALGQRLGQLEQEMARRRRTRRVKAAVGAVSVLAAVGVALWYVMAHVTAGDLGTRLKKAVSQRQVRQAEKLLAQAEKSALRPSTAAARTFVKKELGLLQRFEDSFARLPKDLAKDPEAEAVAVTSEDLTAAKAHFNALAPDLQSEKRTNFLAYENRWDKYLVDSRASIHARVEASIATAEQQCAALDFAAPLERIRTNLHALSGPVTKLADFEARLTNQLALTEPLSRRLGAVRLKYGNFERELKKLDTAVSDLVKARTFPEYTAALEGVGDSRFTGSLAEPARAAMDLKITPEKALRPLLCGENPRLWNYCARPADVDFLPPSVLPAEKALCHQFLEDPNLASGHYRYRFCLEMGGQKPVDWITRCRLIGGGSGFTEVLAYAIADSPAASVFQKSKFGYQNGNYYLTATQRIYDLTEVEECKQNAAYRSLGLDHGLLSEDEERWRLPPLKVLDGLNRSREGSSLFRAYLFLKVVELMEMQVEESGLWFAPAARRSKERLASLGATQLRSGDWFAPERDSKFSAPLRDFFEANQAVSFWTQAVAIASVTREAHRSGFQYAGCLGPEGQPTVTFPSPPAELWGYSAANRSPALLFMNRNGQLVEVEKPLALSPLFALKQPRAEMLAKAGIDPKSPLFDQQLPPLFSPARSPN